MDEKFKFIIVSLSIALVYYSLTLAFIPLFAGFYLGGFEEQFPMQLVWLYVGPGMVFILGYFALIILSIYKGKEQDNKNILFIHRPWVKLKFLNSISSIILLSILFFGVMGVGTSLTQTFFSETPTSFQFLEQQQFTETGKVLFSAFPAAPAENAGAILLHFFVMFFVANFLNKRNIKNSFIVFIILFIILSLFTYGFYGYANHKLRYGASDISINRVIEFWAFMGFVNSITGSIIPGEVMHISNNMFLELNKLFSSDLVVSITIAMILLLITSYIFIYIIFIRKKSYDNPISLKQNLLGE